MSGEWSLGWIWYWAAWRGAPAKFHHTDSNALQRRGAADALRDVWLTVSTKYRTRVHSVPYPKELPVIPPWLCHPSKGPLFRTFSAHQLVKAYYFHLSGFPCFPVWLAVEEKQQRAREHPLMLDFLPLSTREWTISTTATLAATEIWSHLIAWWTVDLFWKSQIMAWPASARPAKTMTRTHSMQVSWVHLSGHSTESLQSPKASAPVVFKMLYEHVWLFLGFQRSFGRLPSCSYTTAILLKGPRRVMCTVLASYCRK